jgi:hypothetical protein
MYKLGAPIVCLDDSFMKKIIQKEVEKEEVQMVDLTHEWWHDTNSFRLLGDPRYHVPKLKKPIMLIAIMLCLLYGEKDSFKFKLGWVPLLHQFSKEHYLIGLTSYLPTSNVKSKNLRNHPQVISLVFLCLAI